MAELGRATVYSLSELEAKLGETKLGDYIRACEAGFMRQLMEIAYEVAWDSQIKAIFISGPSSSGKTTFATRLSSALHVHGRPTSMLSLDDYYSENLEPQWIDGRPDLESFDTVDMDLLTEQLAQLLEGREVLVPRFDFQSRRRVPAACRLRVPPRGILLVEGLHGLNEKILASLPRERYRSVFIMPYAVLMEDHMLMDARLIRIFRRTCRDRRHRNASVLTTLDYWPMLDRSEGVSIPAYLPRADFFVNSAMGYEFGIIPGMTGQMIREELTAYRAGRVPQSDITKDGSFADLPAAIVLAERLIRIAERLPSLDPDLVPYNSILNEFMH